jgi:3-hydroxyacyl-CoA dehydrogenase
LEIVRTRQTSPQVVVDLLDVVEKIKIDRAITKFGMPMGPFRLRRII